MTLSNLAIEVRTDRAGREFAQYWSMKAMRWIRMSLAEAKLELAGRQ